MGLTTAMYTGLTGLNVNQTRIETIGNNLANVNTTAFKGSRTLFQTQVSQLLAAGSAPNANSGGVNPTQVGLGALVGGTQKVFTPGSIETTGIASDLAIDGSGFFIVRRPNGQQLYTRDGSFSVDSRNRLVTVDGYAVRGFGVDSNFNLVPTVLTDLSIPLGTTTIARPTSTVIMDGDLSAASTVATRGSISVSQTLLAGGGGLATADTLLTDLRSASAPGVPLLAAGNTITVAGVEKGDRELPRQSFVVGRDGATLGDFARWLEGVLGINRAEGVPGAPGVTVENGALTITSNAGEPNAIRITTNDFSSDNGEVPLPFTFTQTQAADGSGVSTAFTLYDSLGNPLVANLTFVLEATPPTGPVWRFYAESPHHAGGTRVLGTGLISFDTQGNFLSVTGNQLQLDRSGSGAASPQTFTLDFTGIHGLSTLVSSVVMAQQDGYPPGTLTGYRIGQDGTINGTFSNGLTRTLGQIALAVMPNPEGLIAESDNTYSLGPNSGNPTITAPGTLGAGQVLSGALELSNVDLSREFIGLITSSTGFQAASRVVSTSSDLLDQLLLIVR